MPPAHRLRLLECAPLLEALILKARSQLFTQPPRWQRAHFGSMARLPSPLIGSWLYESGSLTLRLRRLCGDRFRVVVLSQSWQKPVAEEARTLGLGPGQRALVREVVLQDGQQPLVVARSVIPLRTLHGADRRLAHLGNRPLGQILFADPRLKRLRLQLTRVACSVWQPDLAHLAKPPQPLWGRRSLYSLGAGHKLLVAEFFLPQLLLLTETA